MIETFSDLARLLDDGWRITGIRADSDGDRQRFRFEVEARKQPARQPAITPEGWEIGVLATLGVAFHLVAPATWKRVLGVTEKAESRRKAQELYPTAPLSRVKDHGRAEALLIAEWGRRHG